jgi:nicotinamidase-related amidase
MPAIISTPFFGRPDAAVAIRADSDASRLIMRDFRKRLSLSRDQPVEPGGTALIIIDVQNQTIEEHKEVHNSYFLNQLTAVVLPNLQRLSRAARETGVEVIYTVIENLTRDGRDRSLDYKLSNIFVAKGSWQAKVMDAIKPGDDDIVLSKTSSSLFNSTNFDYLLRNLGVEHLVVTGLLTDQCVDHTVRDAADRGYRVVCISDACTTHSEQRHESALSLFAGYCRIVRTDDLINELHAAARSAVQ